MTKYIGYLWEKVRRELSKSSSFAWYRWLLGIYRPI